MAKESESKQRIPGKTEKTLLWVRNISALGFVASALIGLPFMTVVTGGAALGTHAAGETFKSSRSEENKIVKDNAKKRD